MPKRDSRAFVGLRALYNIGIGLEMRRVALWMQQSQEERCSMHGLDQEVDTIIASRGCHEVVHLVRPRAVKSNSTFEVLY